MRLGQIAGGVAQPGRTVEQLGRLVEQLIEGLRADADGGIQARILRRHGIGHGPERTLGHRLGRPWRRGERGGTHFDGLDVGHAGEGVAHLFGRLGSCQERCEPRSALLLQQLLRRWLELEQRAQPLELALDDERARPRRLAALGDGDEDVEARQRGIGNDGLRRLGQRDRRGLLHHLGHHARGIGEPRDQADVPGLLLRRALHLLAQRIGRLEEQIDLRPLRFLLLRLELADEGFGRVGDLDDRIQADRGRASLDGMDLAEDRVPERAAGGLLLEPHQLGVQLRERLAGFGNEERQVFL